MLESDFVVHGDRANSLVTPSEDRVIYRGREKIVNPVLETFDIGIGDMYKHRAAGHFYVVKDFEGNLVVYIYQQANGNLKEKKEFGYIFKADTVLLEAGDPEHLHSFLLQPHIVEKRMWNKVEIFRLFSSNPNIKRKGVGRYIRFCKEDIAREYPWYKL